MRIWLLLLLVLGTASKATQYLYPVGYNSQESSYYLIEQQSPSDIKLFEWDPVTGMQEQLLLTHHNPAGFRLLPDLSGFSFIDNGILKVKKFIKRSPRTIDLDAPIYQIELVHWITDKLCYTGGKYKHNFGIYQIDWEGEVLPLYYDFNCDSMYPQKIDNQLYFIERSKNWRYRILQVPYQPVEGAKFTKRLKIHEKHAPQAIELLDFKEQPIVFLKMISDREGFVVGHPAQVNRTELTISFSYFHIINKEGEWRYQKLFTFDIPSELLFLASQERLYESILPLLPSHCGETILFSDCKKRGISLFAYSIEKQTIKEMPKSFGYFPAVAGCAGGMIASKESLRFLNTS